MNRILRAAEALGVPKFINFRANLAKTTAVAMAISGLALNAGLANAATFTSARVALSDPRPSATNVTYTVTVSGVTSANIKCVKADFSSSQSTSVAIGNGFTAASASVTAASSTLTNGASWTATPATNSITYTNATGVTPSTTTGATFVIAGVTNTSQVDTGYWVRFNTYDNVDCATQGVDSATVGFINTNGSTMSLSVDPTLTFTVNAVAGAQSCAGSTTTAATTSTTIPFGTVTSGANALACQDLTASSNSTNGYTIFARYTSAPTNAINQTLADWTGTNSAPTDTWSAGTEAYGYTTNDATLGTGTAGRFSTTKYAAMTTANSEVAYEAAGVTSTTYRIGHQVGVSTLTKPGTYTTTIIYTCTPVY